MKYTLGVDIGRDLVRRGDGEGNGSDQESRGLWEKTQEDWLQGASRGEPRDLEGKKLLRTYEGGLQLSLLEIGDTETKMSKTCNQERHPVDTNPLPKLLTHKFY